MDLTFENAGQLIERPVNVGDEVKTGTIMARIDPREFESALVRAESERDRAKALLDRVLSAGRAVSEQDVTDARARYNQADAHVRIRQKDLEDTRIIAPFDGTVSRTFVDNFQNVRAKQPVLRFLDVSKIEMVVGIPEDRISLASYVRDVTLRFDALPGIEISRLGSRRSATRFRSCSSASPRAFSSRVPPLASSPCWAP